MKGVCTRCGAITASGSRCDACGPAPRPSLAARGYPRDWPARRARQLRREPRCQAIINGVRCARRATDADHILRRKDGGSDDPVNLQSLCHAHHSVKTARETGWGRPRAPQGHGVGRAPSVSHSSPPAWGPGGGVDPRRARWRVTAVSAS